MNKVILVGNLGADPEVVETQGGTTILKIRMATKERVKLDNGSYGDGSEWHNVVMFGKGAAGLSRILKKGDRIGVDGSISTSSWEKDGVMKYRTEIKTFDIELLGSKQGGGRQSEYGVTNPTYSQPDDSEIPF